MERNSIEEFSSAPTFIDDDDDDDDTRLPLTTLSDFSSLQN